VGVLKKPVDGGVGDGLGHEFVEARWLRACSWSPAGSRVVGSLPDAGRGPGQTAMPPLARVHLWG
jgi:hypothetical protein